MRITQVCEGRDSFSGEKVSELCAAVGGKQLIYSLNDSYAGVHSLYISSHSLSHKQLNELWEEGTDWVQDEVWEARTFKGILNQIRAYAREMVGG